jgi:hypothetical protein
MKQRIRDLIDSAPKHRRKGRPPRNTQPRKANVIKRLPIVTCDPFDPALVSYGVSSIYGMGSTDGRQEEELV